MVVVNNLSLIAMISIYLATSFELFSIPSFHMLKIKTTFLPTNASITVNPAPSIIKSSINPSISRTKSPIKEATATINETGRNLIAADEMDTNVIKYIELLFTNGINVNYNNSFLFDHLEKQKYFFTQSICHFSNRYKSDEINALLIIKLIQFIREKISIESIWTKLIEPIPNMKNIKIFIAENGQFEIIKLVQYLVVIYDSDIVYCMISYCIDLLVVIIKYMNKNGNDIIKQQCCNCIMDILSHNKLMEHMKCGNTPTNYV